MSKNKNKGECILALEDDSIDLAIEQDTLGLSQYDYEKRKTRDGIADKLAELQLKKEFEL